MIIAAFYGDKIGIQMLLEIESTDVNISNMGENTALVVAAKVGHYDIVRLILKDRRFHPHKHSQISRALIAVDALGGCKSKVVRELLKSYKSTERHSSFGGFLSKLF